MLPEPSRVQRGPEFRGPVEIPRLGRRPHGLGFDERADCRHLHGVEPTEVRQGTLDQRAAVTEVRAEADVRGRGCHGTAPDSPVPHGVAVATSHSNVTRVSTPSSANRSI